MHRVVSWDGSNLTLEHAACGGAAPEAHEPFTLHLVDYLDVVARYEPAAADDPDDEACRTCRASTGDGEGWDGECGNCADRSYAAEERAARLNFPA
jgi:hypothetical protein